jgi:phosphoglucosamine mutase
VFVARARLEHRHRATTSRYYSAAELDRILDATTGDGLLTALRVIDTAVEARKGLDELTCELEIYPQRLVNVRIKSRKPLSELPAVNEEIRAAERDFGDAGRVLVRFSGTEPLARVMVEGPDLERVEAAAARIAAAIERDLGA